MKAVSLLRSGSGWHEIPKRDVYIGDLNLADRVPAAEIHSHSTDKVMLLRKDRFELRGGCSRKDCRWG